MKDLCLEKVYLRLGCEIHYWVINRESNKWVIFLHGAGLDHRMFDAQIRAIPANYNMLLWDQRGHGKSRPIGIDYSFDIVIDDLVGIMDREKCSNVIFTGHSEGGNISQEINFRYPERVEKLILIGSNCNTKKLSISEEISKLIMPISLKVYPWNKIIKDGKKACSVYKRGKNYLEECYENIGKDDYKKILLETRKAFHFEDKYKINKPVLFLYGEYDKTLYTRKGLEYWYMKEHNNKCYMIKKAAHDSNQDNPSLVNKLIMEFLEN